MGLLGLSTVFSKGSSFSNKVCLQPENLLLVVIIIQHFFVIIIIKINLLPLTTSSAMTTVVYYDIFQKHFIYGEVCERTLLACWFWLKIV